MNTEQYNRAVNNVRTHLRAVQFTGTESLLNWMVDQCNGVTDDNCERVFAKMKADEIIVESRDLWVALPEHADEII